MNFWQKQINRARELAEGSSHANELMVFYTHLLRAQLEVSEFLRTVPLTGKLEQDVSLFRSKLAAILSVVEEAGPAPLVELAKSLRAAPDGEVDEMLLSYWHAPSDTEFFAKAFLQPYGQLVENRIASTFDEKRCPFCGGKPQLSFLQNKEVTAESGNRDLMCAKCLSTWPFRRVVCANCGEEDPARLGYFQTTAIEHVRIEACDTCKHYIKGVDLTRLGMAEPLVDEIAAAPLDLWATEHGYNKIAINLIGL